MTYPERRPLESLVMLDLAGVKVLPVVGLGDESRYLPGTGVLVDFTRTPVEVDDFCSTVLDEIIGGADVAELS